METKLGRKVFSVTKRNLIGRSVKMRRSNRRFSPVGLATFGLSHGFKAEEVLPDWLLHQVLRLETTSPLSSPSTGPSTHLRAPITKFKSESLEISAQTTPDSPWDLTSERFTFGPARTEGMLLGISFRQLLLWCFISTSPALNTEGPIVSFRSSPRLYKNRSSYVVCLYSVGFLRKDDMCKIRMKHSLSEI
jgi:hypothetical protein